MGDDHDMLREMIQALMLLSDQIMQNAPFDIINILDPIGHVFIGHREKRVRVFSHDG